MKATVNNFEIDYRIEGAGRVIALAHSLGMAGRIFDPMRPVLAKYGRVLTWDARGNGDSQKPATGWSIEDLASDLKGLLGVVGTEHAVVGGLSMGGCTAVAYAVAHPDLVDGLILVDTTAGYGEDKRDAWEERAAKAETGGMAPVFPFNLPRWFSEDWVKSNPERTKEIGEILLANDLPSYGAACRALGAFDAWDQVHRIKCPTLIIVGAEDPATPVAMSERLHENIPGSELHVLDGLRHMSAVEAPERVGGLIASFLSKL